MRVGLVVYGGLDGTSGGFRYDRKLVEYLRSRGDTVEVIGLPWRSYWRCLADGVDPRIGSHLDRPVDVLIEDELCHPSLWRHNHRLTQPGAVVALVHHVDSDDRQGRLSRLRRWVERRYLDTVDGAVCTSEFTRRRATAVAPSLGPTTVAPPAGRIEGRAVSETRVRQRATDGPLEIVFVGNLVPRKGLTTLLSAVERVATDGRDDWRLTVVGSHEADPSYAERAIETAATPGIDDRVEFTDEVTDDELAATLETSHVLCVPSEYEGFGMVYLEAMEYGVVPIATQRGGAGEFVTDGDNGYLVAPGDDARIADLLADLAADRERLTALGGAALDTASAHPSWDETLGEVRSFLTEVAASESAAVSRGAMAEGDPSHAGQEGQP